VIKVFGAAFDPLDLTERVDLKLAYLNWLKDHQINEGNLSDPYDFLENYLRSKNCKLNNIEWIGKFPIESWLRPKPSISDIPNIFPGKFTEFLDSNGCYDYRKKLVDYLKGTMHSSVPVMIGVDHCLTGGAIEFLKEKYDQFNILIFDSHCDIVDLETRRCYFEGYLKLEDQFFGEEIYECGSFLSYLLNERVIKPENLWIIGTQDLDQFKENAKILFSKKILPWIEQGIHIVSKENLLLMGVPDEIKGPTYVSFDVDLGSLSSVFATRFLNYIGLNIEQILNLVDELSKRIRSKKIELIGLDIMEIDIHFLGENVEGHQDYTPQIAYEIIEKMIYRNFAQ
jgi:arginase family enzyme